MVVGWGNSAHFHPVIQLAVAGRKRDIAMAIFRSDDGREVDEKDVLKAVKFYEFLYNEKHTEISRSDRSNRGGSRPKPAAKLRKSLNTFNAHNTKVVNHGDVTVSVRKNS